MLLKEECRYNQTKMHYNVEDELHHNFLTKLIVLRVDKRCCLYQDVLLHMQETGITNTGFYIESSNAFIVMIYTFILQVKQYLLFQI